MLVWVSFFLVTDKQPLRTEAAKAIKFVLSAPQMPVFSVSVVIDVTTTVRVSTFEVGYHEKMKTMWLFIYYYTISFITYCTLKTLNSDFWLNYNYKYPFKYVLYHS